MKRSFPRFFLIFLLAGAVLRAETDNPSVGRWTSFGNGPSHSGYYPVTIGDTTTVAGWAKSFDGLPINQVVVSDGRVFVTTTGYTANGDGSPVVFAAALDSTNGKELWRHPLSGFVDAPVVSQDRVFVEVLYPSASQYVLRAGDGSTQWVRDLYTGEYSGPVVVGDRIWANNSDGIYGFRISDNSQRFFAEAPYTYYGCAHSYYDGVLYVVDPENFYALDAEAGTRLWIVPLAQGGVRDAVPAIMDGKASIISWETSRLITLDLKTKSILWSITDYALRPALRPATDGSSVYAFFGLGVNAYAADTGKLRGRYSLPSGGEYPQAQSQPLITNDLVMISATGATYIFDKATFQLRTQLGVGGYLSFAAGTLYVADIYGNLTTFRFPGAPPEPTPSPWPSPTPSPPPPARTTVELVSINQLGTSTANFLSFSAAINSADGRFVLFASEATDLTTLPDNNNWFDLFLRDRKTGVTQAITINSTNTAMAGPSGIGDSDGKLTPDGRFVLFSTARADLVPETGSDYGQHVFVRDVQARKTILVSVDLDGKPAKGFAVDISWDGRFVLFESEGKNLVPNHTSGPDLDVYLRDVWTNTTRLVSVNEGGRGDGDAKGISLSGDGRFALFQAPGLLGFRQLFVRDLVIGLTTLASKDSAGTGAADASCFAGRMSENGRYVVFESEARNLLPRAVDEYLHSDVYLRDLQLGVTERISGDFRTASVGDISADGQVIAFFAGGQIYINDRRAGTTEQLTTGGGGLLDLNSTGRFVVFETGGENFGIDNDHNHHGDVFLHDRLLRTTRLISHDVTGSSSGDGDSYLSFSTRPAISDDGQTVVFSSEATNLVTTPKYPTPDYIFPYQDVYVSTIEASGSLLNISTRAQVQNGDNVLIGGFILTGAVPKKIMIRALGPSLATAGLDGVMADPILELYGQSGNLIATNDNWQEDPANGASGIPPSHSLESALVRSLNPGAYTAVVRGAKGSTGIALVELYDLESNAKSSLANISTRGVVDRGDNVMIAGFIAGNGGGGGVKVLFRALGPTLGTLGVAGALSDPMLEVLDPNGTVIASNDDWKAAQQIEIEATGLAPPSEKESAILKQLAPGPYTAIVRGKDNSAGIGLVEVYHLP